MLFTVYATELFLLKLRRKYDFVINTRVRQVYDFVSGLFTIGNRSAILVNSTFTKELVERFLCRNTIVVYPPVDVKAYWSLAENQKRKCARTALYSGKKLSVGEKNESI